MLPYRDAYLTTLSYLPGQSQQPRFYFLFVRWWGCDRWCSGARARVCVQSNGHEADDYPADWYKSYTAYEAVFRPLTLMRKLALEDKLSTVFWLGLYAFINAFIFFFVLDLFDVRPVDLFPFSLRKHSVSFYPDLVFCVFISFRVLLLLSLLPKGRDRDGRGVSGGRKH